MWRAFFFAVGTMLIILGVECLMVERFVVQKARVPAVMAKVLDGTSKKAGANASLAQTSGVQAPGASVSSFGPSRFTDGFSNADGNSGDYRQVGSYYGGVPSNGQSASSNSGFSLAGFGQQQNGNALSSEIQSLSKFPDAAQTHVIQPKDWMPWSLLAAGTLVVLYTNTTTGRGFAGGE